MQFFMAYARRPWYYKKKFAIPFGILITLLIGGVILGSVMGAKAVSKGSSTTGLLSLFIRRSRNECVSSFFNCILSIEDLCFY